DLEEYIADTNPTNAASYFRIGTASGSSVLVIGAASSSSRVYNVLWKTNLIPDSLPWLPYALDRLGTGSNLLFSVTNTTPNGYFIPGVKLP
ncbi:MAG TPA: hypothetical protein VIH35_07185, partial [Kiritimatiellia bacterium]